MVLVVKNLPANAGDMGFIPGSRRSPGGGHGNPLLYPCLENPKDRGAWWALSIGCKESDTTELTEHVHVYYNPTIRLWDSLFLKKHCLLI